MLKPASSPPPTPPQRHQQRSQNAPRSIVGSPAGASIHWKCPCRSFKHPSGSNQETNQARTSPRYPPASLHLKVSEPPELSPAGRGRTCFHHHFLSIPSPFSLVRSARSAVGLCLTWGWRLGRAHRQTRSITKLAKNGRFLISTYKFSHLKVKNQGSACLFAHLWGF